MGFDIDLFKKFCNWHLDDIASIEKKFASRYFASLEIMNELEKRRTKFIAELRKKHNYSGPSSELFLAAKIYTMDEIMREDATVFCSSDLDEKQLRRVIDSRIQKLVIADAEKKGTTLFRFLNRPDIFSLISNLRNRKLSWENISLYLAKYHSKDVKLANDNQVGRLSKSHLSRTWTQVVRARNRALKVGETNE